MKKKYFRYLQKLKPRGIQSVLMIVLSVISISIMIVLGLILYMRFSTLSREDMVQSTQKLTEQAGESMEDYLVSMRQISDVLYYNIIKENDFSNQDQVIQEGMNLMYEANRENLRSVALYNSYGSLMAAEPVVSEKADPNVTQQDWYVKAMEEVENVHFSTPHIQNLFDDNSLRYYWVISLSRAVEITEDGVTRLGVLLVDMDYSGISRMMNKLNTDNNGQYYYLCDSNGEIIYHPRQIQISDGISSENSKGAAEYKDGVYDEKFEGERRKVVVNTISYTGWKLVGVIPYSTFTHGMIDIRYFIVMIILVMIMMLCAINRVVSQRISRPVLLLNESVREYEAGKKPEIYIGGSPEIRHLGQSIQNSYEQIDRLMKEIVLEQNERRKSELDALQSQINPHFLYNALHAKSYMNIQKIRYKNTFSVKFDVDEEVYSYCTVKLILQPILENAINYGVSSMDDCGEIRVTGRKEGEVIILAVEDNGLGMSEEEVEFVLTDSNRIHKHGSGVGLININNRIQILFGKEYGLVVESEPDEGTKVSIRIPAVPYTEENGKILENGYILSKEKINDIEEKTKESKDEE